MTASALSSAVPTALGFDDRWTVAVTGAGTALAAAVGVARFGLPGAVAGCALLVAWLVASPVTVVALGHVLFAALFPTAPFSATPTLAALVLVETALLVVLLGDLVDRFEPLRTLVLGLATAAWFAVLAVAAVTWLDAYWLVAATVVGVSALLGYGLHRYTVATLEAPP